MGYFTEPDETALFAHRTARILRPRDLRRAGIKDARQRRLHQAGRLIRVGHGAFVAGDASAPVIRALRAGVRLTCSSALTLHGYWDISQHELHVAGLRTGPRAASISSRRGMVFHNPPPRSWPDDSALMSPDIALEHAVRCLGVEDAAILVESGLRRGLIDAEGVADVVCRLPLTTQRAPGTLRADADSGTETRVRRFFEKLHVPVRVEVEFLEGRWRVDILVGDRLVIECDSIAFHTGVTEHARTYRKRLELQQLGLHVVSLTYAQVMDDWERTMAILSSLIREGVHRGRGR